MHNTLKLAIVAVIWIAAMRVEAACPPGYDCAALERFSQAARDETAATVPVMGGVAQLFDTPCGSRKDAWQFIVRNPNTKFAMPITAGCWRFSTALPGFIEYTGTDGGDVWPLCAVTFYGRYRHLNGDIAKVCKQS